VALLLLLLLLEDEGGVEAPLCFLWRVAGARIALLLYVHGNAAGDRATHTHACYNYNQHSY